MEAIRAKEDRRKGGGETERKGEETDTDHGQGGREIVEGMKGEVDKTSKYRIDYSQIGLSK